MTVPPPVTMPVNDPPAWQLEDLRVNFQPAFTLSNGLLASQAACLGYCHPQLGFLQGDAIHEQATNEREARALSQFLLVEAIEHYIKWRGTAGPGLSVDVTPANMTDPGYQLFVQETVRQMRLPASLLTLNCPALSHDMTLQEVNRQVQALRLTGARLSLEVNGRAGHLLKNIHPFPFDEINISGALVERALNGSHLSPISEVFEVAKSSGAQTVATDIGNAGMLRTVMDLGFSAARGDFLGPPSDIQAFAMSRINDVRRSLDLAPYSQQELVGALSAVKRKNKKRVQRVASATALPFEQEVPEGGQSSPAYRDLIRHQLRRVLAPGLPQSRALPPDVKGAPAIWEPTGEDGLAPPPPMARIRDDAAQQMRHPAQASRFATINQTPARPGRKKMEATGITGPLPGQRSGFRIEKGKIMQSIPHGLIPKKYPTNMRLLKDGSALPMIGRRPIRLVLPKSDTDPGDTGPGDARDGNPFTGRTVTSHTVTSHTVTSHTVTSHTVTSRAAQAAVLRDPPARRAPPIRHDTAPIPEAGQSEDGAPPPIPEADMMSEDEVLDAFLEGSELLDPMGPSEQKDGLAAVVMGDEKPHDGILVDIPADELAVVRQVAARHHQQRSSRSGKPRGKKNFLQRRYKITHFWPRSWSAFFATDAA